MDLELAGKTIFIAGSSRGIGLGIAEALLDEGAKVALAARGGDALAEQHQRLADQYGADNLWSQAGDLRDSKTINKMVDEIEQGFGPIWGAVANVGLHPCPPGFQVDDEIWDGGVDQNLGSAFKLSRAVLTKMEPRGEGALLLISSIAGIDALGSPITYGVSKSAMNHMAKELAKQVGPAGIRVNALAPGNIIFPGGTWEEASIGPRADAWKRWLKREVALQRFGTPEEMGSAAAFMLSPKASFLTGAVVNVDGGQIK